MMLQYLGYISSFDSLTYMLDHIPTESTHTDLYGRLCVYPLGETDVWKNSYNIYIYIEREREREYDSERTSLISVCLCGISL